MIEFRKGDLLQAEADALVNSVNCVGVMARGIAQQFKSAFPDNSKSYKNPCERHEVQPGSMFLFETGSMVAPHSIINFSTKRHWRNQSRFEDIEAGLLDLMSVIRQREIESIT